MMTKPENWVEKHGVGVFLHNDSVFKNKRLVIRNGSSENESSVIENGSSEIENESPVSEDSV